MPAVAGAGSPLVSALVMSRRGEMLLMTVALVVATLIAGAEGFCYGFMDGQKEPHAQAVSCPVPEADSWLCIETRIAGVVCPNSEPFVGTAPCDGWRFVYHCGEWMPRAKDGGL